MGEGFGEVVGKVVGKVVWSDGSIFVSFDEGEGDAWMEGVFVDIVFGEDLFDESFGVVGVDDVEVGGESDVMSEGTQ